MIRDSATIVGRWLVQLSTPATNDQFLQMRSAARMPHAQEVSALIHRQRLQAANLVDERSLAFGF
jgi:hypothetical protein